MLRLIHPLVLVLLACLTAPETVAATDKDLWPRWRAHAADGPERIDHGVWTELLREYRRAGPDGVSRFAYGKVSETDRQRLDAYIDRLADTAITEYPRPVQLAYWLNLYNALTVDLVLEDYPVETIRDIDISPGWFSDGPWGKALVRIESEPVTLNDIEYRILRPIWEDPRIHYGVNCASLGCPELPPRAFTAANTEDLLDAAARTYINHPPGVTVREGRVIASKIYHWYQEDFGGSEAGVLDHLRQYAQPELRERLAEATRIHRYRYDWALNDPD